MRFRNLAVYLFIVILILTFVVMPVCGATRYVKGDLNVSGKLLARSLEMYSLADNTFTVTSAMYGKVLLYSPTNTAGITMPPNGATAGSHFYLLLLTDQSTTVTAATHDTLITNGDVEADSVAFSTSSHKIGGMLLFISNGTSWIVVNISDCTMTVAS